MRLWDARHHHHLLVNYPNTFNKAATGRQMASTEDGRLLFHPSGTAVQVSRLHCLFPSLFLLDVISRFCIMNMQIGWSYDGIFTYTLVQ